MAEAIKSAHFENDPEMTISRIQNRLRDLQEMKFVAGLRGFNRGTPSGAALVQDFAASR